MPLDASQFVENPPGDTDSVPRPGQIFDPVARAFDLVGDRWTLVLVRHLLAEPRGFQELRRRTGIAPRVLSRRLRQLALEGWITTVPDGARHKYRATPRGETLQPLIAAAARWWVHHAMEDHVNHLGPFNETSAQSVLESLPFLLREARARDADVTFEIRLTGEGGGVWAVRICDGACAVTKGFAERADVRYTADARVWCAVAVGLLDPRDAHKRELLIKDGGREALDDFFHQIPRPGATPGEGETRPGALGDPAANPRKGDAP